MDLIEKNILSLYDPLIDYSFLGGFIGFMKILTKLLLHKHIQNQKFKTDHKIEEILLNLRYLYLSIHNLVFAIVDHDRNPVYSQE